VEGYTLPGQAAMTLGAYYLQLNALSAGADPVPAEKLAMAMKPYLDVNGKAGADEPQIDLIALAGTDAIVDAEGFIPESAFGFSSFSNVRTVEVSLSNTAAVWFTCEGNEETVSAYAEELMLYGGEQLFKEEGISGGSMFGSWSMAGVIKDAVWGIQNAPSREALLQHRCTLRERLSTGGDLP